MGLFHRKDNNPIDPELPQYSIIFTIGKSNLLVQCVSNEAFFPKPRIYQQPPYISRMLSIVCADVPKKLQRNVNLSDNILALTLFHRVQTHKGLSQN